MLVPEARFGVPDVCLGLQDASRCRPDGLELDSICHLKPSECFRDSHHGPYSLESIMYGHICFHLCTLQNCPESGFIISHSMGILDVNIPVRTVCVRFVPRV